MKQLVKLLVNNCQKVYLIKELELCEVSHSFVYQDNLCIYGVVKNRAAGLTDLFMLNLSKF